MEDSEKKTEDLIEEFNRKHPGFKLVKTFEGLDPDGVPTIDMELVKEE